MDYDPDEDLQHEPLPEDTDPIIRMGIVMRMVGMPRSSIYSAINRGDFPEPVELSPRTVGWFLSDVKIWMLSRRRVRLGENGLPIAVDSNDIEDRQ